MIDPHETMRSLAQSRAAFHSEADFQHAFAWVVHERLPDAAIRLEFPIRTDTGVMHVDLVAQRDDRTVVIELKYKTRALAFELGSELFDLTDHAAQLPGRYDFLKDVSRLEGICRRRRGWFGYAVLLTNDSAYWKAARTDEGLSAAFCLTDGRIVAGELRWGELVSPNTCKNREGAICLSGQYSLRWSDYSRLPVRSYGAFRYLCIDVVQLDGISV